MSARLLTGGGVYASRCPAGKLVKSLLSEAYRPSCRTQTRGSCVRLTARYDLTQALEAAPLLKQRYQDGNQTFQIRSHTQISLRSPRPKDTPDSLQGPNELVPAPSALIHCAPEVLDQKRPVHILLEGVNERVRSRIERGLPLHLRIRI